MLYFGSYRYFQPRRDNKIAWDIFCAAFFSMKLIECFHIPPPLRTGKNFFVKLFFPIQYSHLLWGFQFFLSILFVKSKALMYSKILQMSRIDCYVVQRIPENLAGGDDFSNYAGLLLWVYVKILFNIFLNFG